MGQGRETRRAARQRQQNAWAVRHSLRQKKINQKLLEIPDICYRVPCLREVF
jgi:hypothetical protein